MFRKVPTRREALATIYQKLRSDTMIGEGGLTTNEALDVLYALGLTKTEISAAARAYGDLRAAAELEG